MIGRRDGPVLGIALSTDAVRALVLHQGSVAWTYEAAIDADGSAEASVRAVLAEATRPRRRGLRVAVAVGPSVAQLRYLRNLPSVRDARTLSAIVQQSAGRYFLQNGTPMITTPVGERADGGGWAGAIEAPVVQSITDACREAKLRCVALLPTAAVLGHAAPGGTLTWHDGDVALELRYDGVRLVECRRLPSQLARTPHAEAVSFDAPLLTLGDDSVRFAGAYGAARGGMASALALRPGQGANGAEPGNRRLALAAVACVAALLLAGIAPSLLAARQERAASKVLAALSSRSEAALVAQRTLADSAGLLSELTAFQRGATSMTLLLASLTRAIQKPAMLVNLRLDPDGGTLTALAPSAASLLTMLASVPEIASPAITGSVTPETSGPTSLGPPPMGMPPMGMPPAVATAAQAAPVRKLERVTIRFAWTSGRRPSTTAPWSAR